ncbi:MAG: hypothetical protein OER91_02880 [Gammaproteobacteria bacterium]|nr:hypothetical protein [Gammaproteobacteria bacterium]
MRMLKPAIAVIALLLAGTVAAQSLPKYYQDADYQRTGRIDSVQIQAQRVVIDDIAYSISSNLIVHSPRAYSVPVSNLKVGKTIGYKLLNGRGRLISEIWLLPDDYEDRGRRR